MFWRLLLFELIAVVVVVGVWFGAPLVNITSVLWRLVIIFALLLPPLFVIIWTLLRDRKAASGLESAIKEQGRAHRERVFAVSTDVRFRALTAGQIRNYLARVNPLDKAGAYAIQEHGHLIVEEISGSYSNVVGLPLERLQEELNAWPGFA